MEYGRTISRGSPDLSKKQHIVLEGYCMFKYLTGEGKDEFSPDASARPEWCKKLTPSYRCLCDEEGNQCPFLATDDAHSKVYAVFDKAYFNLMDDGFKEDKPKSEGVDPIEWDKK